MKNLDDQIRKPFEDLTKGLNGLETLMNDLKNEIPNSLKKEEAERLNAFINQNDPQKMVNELKAKFEKIKKRY